MIEQGKRRRLQYSVAPVPDSIHKLCTCTRLFKTTLGRVWPTLEGSCQNLTNATQIAGQMPSDSRPSLFDSTSWQDSKVLGRSCPARFRATLGPMRVRSANWPNSAQTRQDLSKRGGVHSNLVEPKMTLAVTKLQPQHLGRRYGACRHGHGRALHVPSFAKPSPSKAVGRSCMDLPEKVLKVIRRPWRLLEGLASPSKGF